MVRTSFAVAALVAGVVGMASSASAGIFEKANSTVQGGFNAEAVDFYKLPTEDGIYDDSIGFSGAGTLAYANKFTIAAGGETITDINLVWGANSAGVTHTLAIWTTPGALTSMTLASTPVNVTGGAEGTAASIDIPDATFTLGQQVYIGFLASGSPTSFFGAWDNTAPSSASSFIWGTGSVGAFTAANIGTAALAGEIAGFGLAGDWMIRANAVPAPSSLALIGLGALAASRRRR
jgi:PEP-CTERM motif